MTSRRNISSSAFALAALATLLLVGCEPSGVVTYPVSGSATFSGAPIESGEIIFRAADGAQGSWAAKIEGGRYALQSTAGAKRVEITAHRQLETTPAPSGEQAMSVQMYIPERYNEKSELAAEITPGGPNQFDFTLEP